MESIPKLMEIYHSYEEWDYRFGSTPDFTNTLETKFDWALVEVMFDVEKGIISKGQIYSDCLVPMFIDLLNVQLASGEITYDVPGINKMCKAIHD